MWHTLFSEDAAPQSRIRLDLERTADRSPVRQLPSSTLMVSPGSNRMFGWPAPSPGMTFARTPCVSIVGGYRSRSIDSTADSRPRSLLRVFARSGDPEAHPFAIHRLRWPRAARSICEHVVKCTGAGSSRFSPPPPPDAPRHSFVGIEAVRHPGARSPVKFTGTFSLACTDVLTLPFFSKTSPLIQRNPAAKLVPYFAIRILTLARQNCSCPPSQEDHVAIQRAGSRATAR